MFRNGSPLGRRQQRRRAIESEKQQGQQQQQAIHNLLSNEPNWAEQPSPRRPGPIGLMVPRAGNRSPERRMLPRRGAGAAAYMDPEQGALAPPEAAYNFNNALLNDRVPRHTSSPPKRRLSPSRMRVAGGMSANKLLVLLGGR